jgi:hypothetical protein
MKTSKFFAAVLLSGVMFVTSVNATEGKNPVSSKPGDNLRSQIVNALSDVSAVGEEVLIRFAVSDKKGFELIQVEGKDLAVVKAVKSELANEKIEVPAEMAGVYSLKVRFSNINGDVNTYDAASDLRSQFANVLSEVESTSPASVKVAFSVMDSNLVIKKVEGNNSTLVSSVERVLAKSSIVPPAELAGNYQVVVKF